MNFYLKYNEIQLYLQQIVHQMLEHIIPKLPMRDKILTKKFYINQLDFTEVGDYPEYLRLKKDNIEIHFFQFSDLKSKENYGQIYIRVKKIEELYENFIKKNVAIHPNGKLELKPWQQKEFSILDLDNNLITFGESI